jgi:glycerate dehydrogenase
MGMRKIVVLDGYAANPGDIPWDGLKALGELKVYDRTPADQIVSRIGDAEYIYTNKTPITRDTLDACPNIKFIGVLATGYDIVDINAAKEKGVTVTNIPGYSTASVAQLVFALLLEICHHVGAHSDAVKAGAWSRSHDFCFWNYPLIELAGKTLGIIGFGRIGQATAKIAVAFGMKVIAYSRHPDKSLETDDIKMMGFDEVLAKADVISLHCPLSPSTRGIINKDTIEKMKDGVIIINTARGPLIVEEDLKEALDSGKVYAAAVDVVSKEPIAPDNPLLTCDNCIITPHFGWAPKEARQRLMDIAVNNLKQYLQGNPVNVVNGDGSSDNKLSQGRTCPGYNQ